MKDLLGREVAIRSVLTNFSHKLVTMTKRIFILDGFRTELFSKE